MTSQKHYISKESSTTLETPFILELLSHKKFSDVTLVIDRLTKEVSENGYEFVDSDSGFLCDSSRKAWMSWLVTAITYWSCKLESTDLDAQSPESRSTSALLDQLSELVALFSGRAASRERVVTFEMHGQSQALRIREPSYGDSDLGWQTWPAGILLASYLSKLTCTSEKITLELGCGTGLVGIASALRNPQSLHYLTDYHENVLLNVTKNLDLNGPPLNVKSQKLDWDWFEEGCISWETNLQLNFWRKHIGAFKTIYAADVLYQLRHAFSVPRVIKAFLAPSYVVTPDALTNDEVPKAYVLIPIRVTHLQDTIVFEKELQAQGLTTLLMQTFSPPTSSTMAEVSFSLDNPIPNLDLLVLSENDYSSVPPRDAILAYRLYVCANYSI